MIPRFVRSSRSDKGPNEYNVLEQLVLGCRAAPEEKPTLGALSDTSRGYTVASHVDDSGVGTYVGRSPEKACADGYVSYYQDSQRKVDQMNYYIANTSAYDIPLPPLPVVWQILPRCSLQFNPLSWIFLTGLQ